MSPEGRAVIVRRVQVFAAIGGLFAIVVAYSPDGPMCGTLSSRCLAYGDRAMGDAAVHEAHLRSIAADDMTGSIAPANADVPAADLGLAQPFKHTVIPGETLHSIARSYGTSAAELAIFNAIDHPRLIKPGDTILIPRS